MIGSEKLVDKLCKELKIDETTIISELGDEYLKYKNMVLSPDTRKSVESFFRIEVLKRIYFNKYVIKSENIPDTYNDYQKEQIINEQKNSLKVWLDYFFDKSIMQPFDRVYWAFNGMLKLGEYNNETGKYEKRTITTIAPFPEFNEDALLVAMATAGKIQQNGENSILTDNLFPRIYSYVDSTFFNKKNYQIDGKWVKYSKGSDHLSLVKDLQNHDVWNQWHLLSEENVEFYLNNSDIYIYYTLDEQGNYTVPRILIDYFNGNSLSSVKGILPDNNLEFEMLKVVAEKIQKLPGEEKFYKKIHDMEYLSVIYEKHKNNQELTLEELGFLYQIDQRIECFGYSQDSRINEIKTSRNQIDDLNKLLKSVGNKNEIHLKLDTLTNAIGLELPNDFNGYLDLSGLTTIEGLKLPTNFKGTLNLTGLTTAEGLKLPSNFSGNLYLGELQNAKGLKLPSNFKGTLDLRNIKSADGLELPPNFSETLILGGLSNSKEFRLPSVFKGSLYLTNLKSARGLELPQIIGGDLSLGGLTSADGLELPRNIKGALFLTDLISAEGLELPPSFNNTLFLTYLNDAEGLRLPQNFKGSLYLDSLRTAKGLKIPENFKGRLHMTSLIDAEGLILPQNFKGSLYLDSLQTAKGLKLPKSIKGELHMTSLTDAEGLILPQNIGRNMSVGGSCLNGAVIPESLKYKFLVSGIDATEIILEEVNSNISHKKR